MKPLSILCFIKGSFKKIMPLAFTVCLAVALLYFLSLVKSQLTEQINEVNQSIFRRISIIYGGNNGIAIADFEKLKDHSKSSELHLSKIADVQYKMAVGGQTGSMVVFVSKGELSSLMEHQKFKLLQGKLPENRMEVLLHRKLAANNGIKLGEIITKKTNGWYLEDDIKIVGLFDGPGVMGLGVEDESLLKPDMAGVSVTITTSEENLNHINDYIENSYGNTYKIYTLGMVNKLSDKVKGPINGAMLMIAGSLIVVLCVLLGNICVIQYTQRGKEFELLYAVGYTRKYIALKILKEIGASNILGYITGIILAVAFSWIINVCYWSEKALDMPLIIGENMLWVLSVPVIITFFAMLAPIKMLKFRDIL